MTFSSPETAAAYMVLKNDPALLDRAGKDLYQSRGGKDGWEHLNRESREYWRRSVLKRIQEHAE